MGDVVSDRGRGMKPLSTQAKALRRLGRLCRSWGGDLVRTSRVAWNERFSPGGALVDDGVNGNWPAPFIDWHGFHYASAIIYVVHGIESPGAIIHEMGHLFADDFLHSGNEFDFFGWEVAVARYAGCYEEWDKQNAGYAVRMPEDALNDYPSVDWGMLSPGDKQRVEINRTERAKQLGLITADAMPLAIVPRPLPENLLVRLDAKTRVANQRAADIDLESARAAFDRREEYRTIAEMESHWPRVDRKVDSEPNRS